MRRNGLLKLVVVVVMSLLLRRKDESQEWNLSFLKNIWYRLVYIKYLCCRRFFFAIAVDVISENAREGLMNEILFADDLVSMSESIENLKKKLLK